MNKNSALASLAGALVGIQVGSAIVATRFVIDQTQPGSLALNPITAAGLGAFFLGEQITVSLLIGIICVILGLGVAHLGGFPRMRGVLSGY